MKADSSIPERELCRLLDWDTRFFGCRIGRLIPARLTPAVISPILDWCGNNRVDCLYFLADLGHCQTFELASQHKFSLVDLRVTLGHCRQKNFPESGQSEMTAVRAYRSGDVPVLRAMAGRLHRDSRFFEDAHFPRERSREMFEHWIEKSCLDASGTVFVAEWQGKPAGYVACRQEAGQTGWIDLLGVEEAAQGQGLGRELVMAALHWFAARDIARVRVVTQGQNFRAQRLYQRCGFVTERVQIWYHRWFEPGADQLRPGA